MTEKMQIGRYKTLKKVTQDQQEAVYLCFDPKLQRKVTIKLLTAIDQVTGASKGKSLEQLVSKTLNITNLQHQNVVSIFDAGHLNNNFYLVFEYVEGRTLADFITDKNMSQQRVIEFMQAIMEGVAYAHSKGVVHGYLTPKNILIDQTNIPKILDFGLSQIYLDSGSTNNAKHPIYIAQHDNNGTTAHTQSDVFSLGLIFYRALNTKCTYRRLFAKGIFSKKNEIILASATEFNADINPRLNALIFKALSYDPDKRYKDAGEFLQSLQQFRNPTIKRSSNVNTEFKSTTIKFLLRRMEHQSDFPVLSSSISVLNQLSSFEDKNIAKMASVIIKDLALTNKILKVVNSPLYRRWAGTISTISRAIMILGFQPLRSLAVGLTLIEHMQSKTRASSLKDELSHALFSGIIAKEVGTTLKVSGREELFVCAMFHRLGNLLVNYYLHDEGLEISRIMQETGQSDQAASRAVLGTSFEEIGVAVARRWNFPSSVFQSIHHVPLEKLAKPEDEHSKKHLIACFCSQISQMLMISETKQADTGLGQVIKQYGEVLNLSDGQIVGLLEKTGEDFQTISSDLAIRSANGQFKKRLRSLCNEIMAASGSKKVKFTKPEQAPGVEKTTKKDKNLQKPLDVINTQMVLRISSETKPEPHTILTEGIQDVTQALAGSCSLAQVFSMTMEIMFRAMNFHRIVLCIKDRKKGEFIATLGFGHEMESFKEGFHFSSAYHPDVFHAALKHGVDIFIEDSKDHKIRDKIPHWYKQLSNSSSFVLFPLIVRKKAFGLIYADKKDAGQLKVSNTELGLLTALRNQVVLALSQKAP